MNYREVCKAGSTDPEYALELLKSMRLEFEQGCRPGGLIAVGYLREKLDALERFVVWLEAVAVEETA